MPIVHTFALANTPGGKALLCLGALKQQVKTVPVVENSCWDVENGCWDVKNRCQDVKKWVYGGMGCHEVW